MKDFCPSNFWPLEGSEMGSLIRRMDWSGSALGPTCDWPAALKIAVSATLDSLLPTVVLWGPQLIQFYNDAYRPILGLRHPAAMGQPRQQCWPEVWRFNEPIYNRVLSTGAYVRLEDQEYVIEPSGIFESRYFTITYAPARDELGVVCGVQVMAMETTRRVDAERKNSALLKAKVFQLELADQLRPLIEPDDITAAASKLLGHHLGVSRVLFSEVDDDNGTFFIRWDWNQDGHLSVAGETRSLNDFGPDMIAALRLGNPVPIDDIALDWRTANHVEAYASVGVRANLAIPRVKAGRLLSVLNLHQAQPYHWSQTDIKAAKDMAERSWAAVDGATIQAQLRYSRSMLRKLTVNQESVREDERKRIARDIHDELGQNLMALRLDVSMMAARSGAVAVTRARVDAALTQIDMTIKSVRTIMNDLRPAVLNLGLHAALEWQVQQFQHRSGIVCELHADHDEFILDDKRSTALFRIVQEALSNIIRHARASQVHIWIQRSDDRLCVKICDDGVGLAPDCRNKINAFGLVGIEERIYALSGTFSMLNNARQGMTVTVSIPLESSALD
jgi:signal transduction histidine kinase